MNQALGTWVRKSQRGLLCIVLAYCFVISSSWGVAQSDTQPQSSNIKPEAIQLNKQGEELLTKKEFGAAAKKFRKALAIQPDYEDAVRNLGIALAGEGKDKEAASDFQKAIKIAPDDAIAHKDLGHTLFHEGKYEESLASYRKAVAIHENYAEAYNGIGVALLKLGKPEEAITGFEKAATLDPTNVDALNNAGAALLGLQRGAEALPYFEKALHLKPDAYDVLENYGAALQQLAATKKRLLPMRRLRRTVLMTPRRGRSWAIPITQSSDMAKQRAACKKVCT
jgi:tetratricopeptide (TPR) repeat protein